ncbi:MAG: NifU family protein [Alphaproteobacteria bacterium]|nr:NifU family protein [Alphaproteobacteria bacterium]
MFIQTEQTPNPATLKFLPGCQVMERGTLDMSSPEDAGASPLARNLFAVDGVCGVFLGSDFISVTKDGAKDWATMKPMVLSAIMEHFTSGAPVVEGAAIDEAEQESDGEDAEIVVQIKDLLDTRVRPAVAQDGGDIVFRAYEDGIVFLHMQGACSGCPSSTATLKMGIENLLKHFIPEVREVRPVE